MATEEKFEAEGGTRLRWAFIVIFTFVLVALSIFGWRDLYERYLEIAKPIVQPLEGLRGLGVAPSQFRIEVSDPESGIRRVRVLAQQGDREEELGGKEFPPGVKRQEIAIDIPGKDSFFEQGAGALVVEVEDNSLWQNSERETFPLVVDFTPPTLELLATSGIRQGGSGLVIYRVIDEEVGDSGLEIGGHFFRGFPARALDDGLSSKGIFAVLFAVPLREATPSLFLIAEDQVGNAVRTPLSLGHFPREQLSNERFITEVGVREILSPLIESSWTQMEKFQRDRGEKLAFRTEKGSPERLGEHFRLAHTLLRRMNELDLEALLKDYRFDRFWTGPLAKLLGKTDDRFGSLLRYRMGDKPLTEVVETRYRVRLPSDVTDVHSVGDGVVMVNAFLGVLGRVLVVDHGLGLLSVYGNLQDVRKQQGDTVEAEEIIGVASPSPDQAENYYSFEMRVTHVPVDPAEWWSGEWYKSTISQTIAKARETLRNRR